MKKVIFDFFYVGKGDCTLIEFPSGKVFGVIDGSKPWWRERSPVAEALQARIKKRKRGTKCAKSDGEIEVAFVCVSHPHYDHVHGLPDVFRIKGVRVSQVWHPLPELAEILLMHESGDEAEDMGVLKEISRLFQEDQIVEFIRFAKHAKKIVGQENFRQVRGNDVLPDIDGVQIYVVNPTHRALNPFRRLLRKYLCGLRGPSKEMYDRISVAVLFVYGENALLYASDMQGAQWIDVISNINSSASLRVHLPVGVMKASHHGGSRSFYSDLWNDALGKNAGSIIASGGDDKHPSDAFIKSAVASQKRLYCTGFGRECIPDEEDMPYWRYEVERLVELYGGRILSNRFRPCCGDIRVVLPEKGAPGVIPSIDKRRKCLP